MPQFNRDNYHRWQRNGQIVSLRQGWYAFADYKHMPDYANYFAGQIYVPSYISLHTALAFYGIIPEAVVDITSVSTQKTARFVNDFGSYSYQTIKPSLFFGYIAMTLQDGKRYWMATPEKAIVDLLYLYPQYRSNDDMLELRFDDDWMEEDLDKERLEAYGGHIGNKNLLKRIRTLLNAYRR